jgi:hypothetical protein
VKNFPQVVVAIGVCSLLGSSAFADDRPNQPAPTPAPAPQWNVRVELLVVDLPQAKALAMLPDLRDPNKIDGAVSQILTAIDQKEATLIGYPVIQAVDGERGVVAPIFEKRYPTEFESPSFPSDVAKPGHTPPPSPLLNESFPTAFETRNTGLALEVTPHVLQGGNWISLDLNVHRTTLLGFDTYVFDVKQPRFITLSTNTNMAVRNGQRTLLAAHKMPEADNLFELDILQAWAEPIK